jgi:dienelactone hydrolase
MFKQWVISILLLASSGFLANSNVLADLREQTIDYRSGDTVMKGFLVWDDAITSKRPGVLVVHEWWGLNDYARSRARQLAQLGYTALALDMYGDGKAATHPADAQEFMHSVMSQSEVMKKRFMAAKSVLERDDTVDPTRIAAIGYCFGGYVVLQMAREGLPLKAVASFHGMLGTETPAQPNTVKAKVAAFNGGDDSMVPQTTIDTFKQEMEAAGVDYQFVNYPGTKHGFTNPEATALGQQFNMPIAYNAAADQDSWEKLKLLLARAFGQ